MRDNLKTYTVDELLDRSIRRLDREPQYDQDRPQWGSELQQLRDLQKTLRRLRFLARDVQQGRYAYADVTVSRADPRGLGASLAPQILAHLDEAVRLLLTLSPDPDHGSSPEYHP